MEQKEILREYLKTQKIKKIKDERNMEDRNIKSYQSINVLSEKQNRSPKT